MTGRRYWCSLCNTWNTWHTDSAHVAAASPSDPAPPDALDKLFPGSPRDVLYPSTTIRQRLRDAGYVLVKGEGLAHGDELTPTNPLSRHAGGFDLWRRVAAAVPPQTEKHDE